MPGKTCQICGAKSGIYPLCKEHLEMKAKGLIIKNSTTGLWELADTTKKNKEKTELWEILYSNNINTENIEEIEKQEGIEFQNDSQICCVCGEPAPRGKQCRNCYYETIDYRNNIDKNRKAHEIREWYYNLKNSLYRYNTWPIDKIESNCNKLVALAILCRDLHNDDSLLNRVYTDIKTIIESKRSKNTEQNENEEQKLETLDFNKNDTSGQVKCTDGHWVENDLEREIDDILYSLRRVHVYAKKVNEITSRAVKSDWFIPILSDTKGIYIELWGMETEDYIKNKEEKIKLYHEEDLPLIEIYRKDVLSDKALLKDNLESEINKLEKELKKRK